MNLSCDRKLLLMLGMVGAAIVAVFFFPPIPQDPHYHDFADQRVLLGIPNFWNVVSNFPFVVVGLLGLHLLVQGPLTGGIPALRLGYLSFFLGVLLVGGGSSYYHLHPSNQTLVWDRIPLTVAIMALLSVLIGEQISIQAGRLLLGPLVVVGLASVLYWDATEASGRGDLRPYVLVQFLPIVLIPVMLLLFRSCFSTTRYFWAILGTYAVAKILEIKDGAVFHALGRISGHSLKHLFAAVGTYAFLLALRKRRPRSTG